MKCINLNMKYCLCSVFNWIHVEKDLQTFTFCFYSRLTQPPNMFGMGVVWRATRAMLSLPSVCPVHLWSCFASLPSHLPSTPSHYKSRPLRSPSPSQPLLFPPPFPSFPRVSPASVPPIQFTHSVKPQTWLLDLHSTSNGREVAVKLKNSNVLLHYS